MCGTFGNFGLLLFSLLIGGLMAHVGYTPFFISLAVLDLVAAALLWIWYERKQHDSKPYPDRFQSRSFHRAGGRRLLHRHLDL
jgi:nitrate/nitrite transporter NarK